jgi:hypothetical protein
MHSEYSNFADNIGNVKIAVFSVIISDNRLIFCLYTPLTNTHLTTGQLTNTHLTTGQLTNTQLTKGQLTNK